MIRKIRKSTAALLAFILILLTTAGSISVTAFADSDAAEVTLENGMVKTFTDFRKAWDCADENSGSTVKMLSDWKLEGDSLNAGSWAITPSKFTLDLNGHTIDGGGDVIICVQSAFLSKYRTVTELTIIDSSPDKSGIMENGGNAYNGGIVVKGILYFNGGTLRNCVCDGSFPYGGGIYVSNEVRQSIVSLYPAGSLIMDGGRIENCTGADIGGGIFLDERSTAHLINGSIKGCSSKGIGGGVYVGSKSTLTMEDGFTISNCTSPDNGGGIHVTPDGTFIMNGGTIAGCSAKEGGGLYISPSGADISGKFLSPATAELLGGSIINNYCTDGDGGGICTDGGFWDSPCFLTLGGSITVRDNLDNGKQSNLYLDSATFDDDTVFFKVKGSLSGKVGISCDEQRRISEVDTYPNKEALFADDPKWDVSYEPKDQCYHLVDMKPFPALVSAELTTSPDGAWTEYDYANHIATINIPRVIGDAENVSIAWTGESALVEDGSWKGKYTESPIGIKFFNFAGVQLFEQNVTFSNTTGDSVTWRICIKGVEKETLYLCNATLQGYVPNEIDPETGYRYYQLYPGTPLCIVPDEAPEGMIFDRWKTNSGSGVFLDDPYTEPFVMDMPSTFNGKFGLKACFAEAGTNGGGFMLGSAPSDGNEEGRPAISPDVSDTDSGTPAQTERDDSEEKRVLTLAVIFLLLVGAILGAAITLIMTKLITRHRQQKKELNISNLD